MIPRVQIKVAVLGVELIVCPVGEVTEVTADTPTYRLTIRTISLRVRPPARPRFVPGSVTGVTVALSPAEIGKSPPISSPRHTRSVALLPRPGFPLERTIQALRELEASSTHFSNPDLMRQWQGYLNWTHSVELFFRTYFTGFRLERLYNRPLLARSVARRVESLRTWVAQ